MKKFKIGLIILSIVFNIGIAKAQTLTVDYTTGYIFTVNNYNELVEWFEENKTIIQNLKDDVKNYYETNYISQYPYYNISILSPNGENIDVFLQMYETIPELIIDETSGRPSGSNHYIEAIYTFENTTYTNATYYTNGNDSIYYSFQNTTEFNDCFFIESNYELTLSEESYYDTITINNFRNNGNLSFSKGDNINLSLDVVNPSYTEINLDNYKYVLLTLKNYNQTKAFQANLQVKGQIGITPIYNYGQTSKDAVTGSQVQDRCNIAYENYTSYPFYIIQTDLQNNVIYAVKECSQGSSFKFDNNIFDVTYVTEANEENPTVTINGKTYDVIPYDDLPSTATKNEEDNYIPGESGSATDTGGLDSAIAGAQNKLSEIWNTFTYFTSFIGLIFSSLPSEVHTILLSAFTIMIVLGIIKIFLGK